MKLIVGLGNPGKKYEKTRHNLGFMVVEQFLKDFETVGKTVWENETKFKSDVAKIEWQTRLEPNRREKNQQLVEKVILVKPKTYMNNSGLAVNNLIKFFKINPSNLWVVHDDIDLNLGTMRIRFGGSSAGQKGVESVMEALDTDKFWRFRMGTGEQKQVANGKLQMANKFVEDYVLGKFSGHERGMVKKVVKRGVGAIEAALEEGLEKAMNEFNTR